MFDSAGSGGWVREIIGKGNFAKGSNLRLVCELVEVPSRLIDKKFHSAFDVGKRSYSQ